MIYSIFGRMPKVFHGQDFIRFWKYHYVTSLHGFLWDRLLKGKIKFNCNHFLFLKGKIKFNCNLSNFIIWLNYMGFLIFPVFQYIMKQKQWILQYFNLQYILHKLYWNKLGIFLFSPPREIFPVIYVQFLHKRPFTDLWVY
jgi:hypothetical protein